MKNYTLIKEEFIKEINSNAQLYKHDKSGARVVCLSNDDSNKVFTIGFRTPPMDDSGVPHILEHSTLCGSKKFPVKDPFVELIKSSLNTFINAITFADKTIYPVASCNDKDFANLMEVYLDAVFYPNVYLHEEIFKQEGWHYELEDKESDLIYNGVVYNEMKGAFSNPEQVVYRRSCNSLYPDNAYGFESGGDPVYIPSLTYEAFKNFHSKYYSPSNSYIVLYGNMDMEERMAYMDREYLSKFNIVEPNSKINEQMPFNEIRKLEYEYPIGKEDSPENKTFYSYNFAIGKSTDSKLAYSFSVLTYILFDAVGAPLKEKLLNSGMCQDVEAFYESDLLQPCLCIFGKNCSSEKSFEFKKLIDETLKEVIKNGIDKKAIYSAINHFEFLYRESNFGYAPKGLIYTQSILETWLYDDNDPFSRLKTEDIFADLKEEAKGHYFENLIETYILNNNHSTLVSIMPSNTLAQEMEQDLKEKLQNIKESLSIEELEKLVADTKSLKEYQATPSTKEELSTLPVLSRDDIEKESQKLHNELISFKGLSVLEHDYFSNGIGYIDLLFDLSCFDETELPYVALLSACLGELDTQNYNSTELDQEVNIYTGGVNTTARCQNMREGYKPYFKVSCKYLYDNVEKAFDLIKEILLKTKFENQQKFTNVIQRVKSMMQSNMVGSGHTVGAQRALSYILPSYKISELLNGIDFYNFISKLCDNIKNEFKTVSEKMLTISHKLFRKENLFISYTGNCDNYKQYLFDFTNELFDDEYEVREFRFVENIKNEGFKIPGQVQYCSLVGKFDANQYSGSMLAFSVALGYDYLWNQIRVLGGAYGAMHQVSSQGWIRFCSYRDPNLSKTYDVYNNIPDFIENYNPTKDEITKLIISAIGNLDAPMSTYTRAFNDTIKYITGCTDELQQKERDELLNTSLEDIKKCKDIYKEVLSQNIICVVGNESKIEKEKDKFKEVKNLL